MYLLKYLSDLGNNLLNQRLQEYYYKTRNLSSLRIQIGVFTGIESKVLELEKNSLGTETVQSMSSISDSD